MVFTYSSELDELPDWLEASEPASSDSTPDKSSHSGIAMSPWDWGLDLKQLMHRW